MKVMQMSVIEVLWKGTKKEGSFLGKKIYLPGKTGEGMGTEDGIKWKRSWINRRSKQT